MVYSGFNLCPFRIRWSDTAAANVVRKLRYLIEKSFNKARLKVPLTISQTLFQTDRLLRHYSMGYGTKYSRMGHNISKIWSDMVCFVFSNFIWSILEYFASYFSLTLSLFYSLLLLFTTFQAVLINNNKKLYTSWPCEWNFEGMQRHVSSHTLIAQYEGKSLKCWKSKEKVNPSWKRRIKNLNLWFYFNE